jgi:hypothetical protein
MLEIQQAQLVIGLQKLYKLITDGRGWIGSPLKETRHGTPLTHDILEQLGALKQDEHSTREAFQEDTNLMQQCLRKTGVGSTNHYAASGIESEVAESTMLDNNPEYSPFFTDLYTLPPTPPDQSPSSQSAVAIPSKIQAYPQLPLNRVAMNPAFLQKQSWDQQNGLVHDNLNFNCHFDSPISLESITALFGQEQAPVGTMKPFTSIKSPDEDSVNLGLL